MVLGLNRLRLVRVAAGRLGGVVVGERGVVDRLTHLGLVRGLQQVQVVDSGGLHRCTGAGFDRGVGVAADGVRDCAAHRLALVFDLDDGQVERGEQQVHQAAGQRGVDLIPVAVQGDGRERGDPPLLTPQERAPQQRGVRSRGLGPVLGVVALGRGGAGFRMHAAVVQQFTDHQSTVYALDLR